jgi:hypothetical protein
MQRLTAKLLLLLTAIATFLPVAFAAIAPAPHACCIRHARRCHTAATSSSDERSIHGTGCCNHDCCRAVTTSHRAHPQPNLAVAFAQRAHAPIAELHPTLFAAEPVSSQSPRAPPRSFLA